MGREVRRVPPDWQHPKDERGHYIPLLGGGFSDRLAEWDEEAAQWAKGYRRDYVSGGWAVRDGEEGEAGYTYAEYAGERPRAENYMPDWPSEQRTHWQMYEDTSEGTPISPVMDTPEALARWLADNNASAFGSATASYEGWLTTINRGFAPSAIMSGGVIQSGVEALKNQKPSP